MTKNKDKVNDKKEIMFVKERPGEKMKTKKKENKRETNGRSLLQNGRLKNKRKI